MSVAAYRAVFQLLRPSRRHYWEKTVHGLVIEHPSAMPSPAMAAGFDTAVAAAD